MNDDASFAGELKTQFAHICSGRPKYVRGRRTQINIVVFCAAACLPRAGSDGSELAAHATFVRRRTRARERPRPPPPTCG